MRNPAGPLGTVTPNTLTFAKPHVPPHVTSLKTDSTYQHLVAVLCNPPYNLAQSTIHSIPSIPCLVYPHIQWCYLQLLLFKFKNVQKILLKGIGSICLIARQNLLGLQSDPGKMTRLISGPHQTKPRPPPRHDSPNNKHNEKKDFNLMYLEPELKLNILLHEKTIFFPFLI